MKIKKVKAFPLRLEFRSKYPANSYGQPQLHDTVITLIETDDGKIGIGEASPSSPTELGITPGYLLDVINDYYAPALIGKDPGRLNFLVELMNRQIFGNIALEASIAAIDSALHDIVGKERGVRAVELLGGEVREDLPAMGGIGLDTPKVMAKRAREFVTKYPFKFMKVKIGGGRIHGTWPTRVDPELDVQRIRLVREALGDRVTIIADANQSYTPSMAIKMIRKLGSGNLMVEQPIDEADVEGLARVARSVEVPIIADESAYTPRLLLSVLQKVPVEFVNIKPNRAGGFLGSMKMVSMVESAGLKCSIDCVLESRVGGAMIAHIAAAVREDAYLNTTATLISDIWLKDQKYWSGAASIEGDHFVLSRKPGLGLDISEDLLEIAQKYNHRKLP